MKNILIGLGVVAVIGVIGYAMTSSNKAPEAMMQKEMMEKEAMMMDEKMKKDAMMQEGSMQKEVIIDDKMMMEKKGAVVVPSDTMMKKDMMGTEMQKEVIAQKGSYVAYSESATAQAVKTGKTILFFHAPWCPTCRAADADILKNAANIPSGTTILKVDYDTSVAMKQKYGVTTQHTFVQVDSTMNAVATWRGGNTLASIIASSK